MKKVIRENQVKDGGLNQGVCVCVCVWDEEEYVIITYKVVEM